jgi:hypothetical protein
VFRLFSVFRLFRLFSSLRRGWRWPKLPLIIIIKEPRRRPSFAPPFSSIVYVFSPSWSLQSITTLSNPPLDYPFRSAMSSRTAIRACHGALRRSSHRSSNAHLLQRLHTPAASHSISLTLIASQTRQFHASIRAFKGILPETSDPPKREPEEHDPPAVKSEISMEDYHKASDHFMDQLVAKFEKRQEEKADIEVEYHVCQQPSLNPSKQS